MSTNLNQIILEMVEQGKEVAPQLVAQFLAWNFWSNLAVAVVSLVVLAALAKFLHICVKKSDDWEEGAVLAGIIAGGLALFFGALLINSSVDCIKIKIAPNVYLIDCVRGK